MTEKKLIGYYIIASAVIWGVVIIGCASGLKGTTCYDKISPILIGGAVAHLIFVWGPLANQFRQAKE